MKQTNSLRQSRIRSFVIAILLVIQIIFFLQLYVKIAEAREICDRATKVIIEHNDKILTPQNISNTYVLDALQSQSNDIQSLIRIIYKDTNKITTLLISLFATVTISSLFFLIKKKNPT